MSSRVLVGGKKVLLHRNNMKMTDRWPGKAVGALSFLRYVSLTLHLWWRKDEECPRSGFHSLLMFKPTYQTGRGYSTWAIFVEPLWFTVFVLVCGEGWKLCMQMTEAEKFNIRYENKMMAIMSDPWRYAGNQILSNCLWTCFYTGWDFTIKVMN